ncbi:hypothetical protein HN953_01215 [Candidatus Woesearchaeota archaeon]|nr:hypothetical protein [Candidatus Woesearchaeota archaeon]
MKNLLMVSLFFSIVLFISGCELMEEDPQFAQVNFVREDIPNDGDATDNPPPSGGGSSGGSSADKSLCNNLGGGCVDSVYEGYYAITCAGGPGDLCALGQICQVPLSGCENAPVEWSCSCEGATVCNDGIVTAPETCERPSTSDNNYCSQSEETCSGSKLGTRDELGNCNYNCQCVEDTFSGFTCDIATCDAQCESGNLNGETCISLGYESGTLGCDTSVCTFDVSECYTAGQTICGDNIIQAPNDDGYNEICDGTDLAGETCASLGYDSGEISCAADCSGFTGCYNEEICEITGLTWEGLASDESRMEGVQAKVNIYGTNGCAGKEVSVQIFEDDALSGDDAVLVNPVNVLFTDLIWYDFATTYWITEWDDDELGSNPEYYIYAELVEDSSVNFQGTALLHISNEMPDCDGDGDGIHQCINDDSDVDTSWFATGSQACDYSLGAGCSEVQYECATIGYDFDLNPILGWGYYYNCDYYLDIPISNPPSYPDCNYRAKCDLDLLPCDSVCGAESPETYCSDPDCSGVAGITRTCANDAVTCSDILYADSEIYAGGANPQILRHPTATGQCSQTRYYYADHSCVDENTVKMRDSVTGAIKEFECLPGRYCTNTGSISSCVDPDARESLCTAEGFTWTGSTCYGDDCSEI